MKALIGLVVIAASFAAQANNCEDIAEYSESFAMEKYNVTHLDISRKELVSSCEAGMSAREVITFDQWASVIEGQVITAAAKLGASDKALGSILAYSLVSRLGYKEG